MIFPIRNSEFGVKHAVLDIYMDKRLADGAAPGTIYMLRMNYFVEAISDQKLKAKVNRCVKSLVVGGYLDTVEKDDVTYIAISRKGLDAYNSEEFVTLENEERRKIINNRYTIAFGVITAFGVIWSLVATIMQGRNKPELPAVKVIIEQQAKMPVHLTDTVVVYVDSSKNSQ